jgi:hypothetical protein
LGRGGLLDEGVALLELFDGRLAGCLPRGFADLLELRIGELGRGLACGLLGLLGGLLLDLGGCGALGGRLLCGLIGGGLGGGVSGRLGWGTRHL